MISSQRTHGSVVADLHEFLNLPPVSARKTSKIRRYRFEILLTGIVLSWGLLALPIYALIRLI